LGDGNRMTNERCIGLSPKVWDLWNLLNASGPQFREYRGLSIAFNSCWESKDSEISFQHREVRRKSDKCITPDPGGFEAEAELTAYHVRDYRGNTWNPLGNPQQRRSSRARSPPAATRIWFRLNTPQTLAQSSPQGAWTRGVVSRRSKALNFQAKFGAWLRLANELLLKV